MIDVKFLKSYLIENHEEITKILKHFKFHDFKINANKEELRCALPDGGNATVIAVNLKTLISSIYKAQDFRGDFFDMLLYWNEHLGNGYKWNLRKLLRIIDENILHLTVQGKDKQYQYPKTLDYRSTNGCKEKSKKESIVYDIDFLNKFTRLPYFDWVKEGILPEVQDKYYICYDDKWSRILIPHFKYDDKTKIVGFQARTTIEKYDLLGISKYTYSKGYEISKNLYGLSHNIKGIRDKHLMVVFEGEKSVMKLETYNVIFPHESVPSVALGGSSLSDWQAECIGQISKRIKGMEVIVCMDKDIENEHVLSMCAKLTNFGCDHVSYIIDDNGLLDGKDSPIDKGFSSWHKLYEERKMA